MKRANSVGFKDLICLLNKSIPPHTKFVAAARIEEGKFLSATQNGVTFLIL
jgi:hypothetical protein